MRQGCLVCKTHLNPVFPPGSSSARLMRGVVCRSDRRKISCRSRRVEFGRCSNATTRPCRGAPRRTHNVTKPTILTPKALTALKSSKVPRDDGGLSSGPKIARWLAKFHGGSRATAKPFGWLP
jgi:hypothetical protein